MGERRIKFAALIAGLAFLGSALVATPAWAANCALFANTPTKSSSDTVFGTGGRSGCTGTVSLKVALKHDKLGPDSVLASTSGNYVNKTLTVSRSCLNGGNKYYVETEASGMGKVQGSRRTYTC